MCKAIENLKSRQPRVHARIRARVISAMLGILFLTGWSSSLLAEVTIQPTSLYLSKTNANGRFSVSNGGTDTKIVDVSLLFGYPVSDKDGNLSFLFLDSATQGEQSMASWASVYPCHFELAPGEFQVVVVITEPPEKLPDGEYWLRPDIRVRSIDSGTPTGGSIDHPTVSTKELQRYILAVNYRQGVVQTGAAIRDISATVQDNRLRLLVDLDREGNAAFRGNIVCSLRNAEGNCVADFKREVAVYHSLRYRIEVRDSEIPDGSYTAKVGLNTNRSGDILHSPPVEKTIALIIKDGQVFDTRSDVNTRVIAAAPASKPTPVRAKLATTIAQAPVVGHIGISNSSRPTHEGKGKDRSNVLANSHERTRALAKRLEEINREQEMILGELRELTMIVE